MSDAVLDSVVRRDRIIVAAALTLLVAVAWLYLVHLAPTMSVMSMDDMPGMAMAEMYEWGWIEVATLAVMWAVMMVAMMTPAAAPMILVFAGTAWPPRVPSSAARCSSSPVSSSGRR